MQVTGRNKSYHTLSLSIRLHADGFSFFVCDLQAGTLMRGEHFTLDGDETIADRLTQELARQDYFNKQINQAFVMVDTPSTLVPLEAFRREEAAALYTAAFSYAQQATPRVAYTIMPHLEAVEIFAIDSQAEEAILQFYPTARFFGSKAMLLERLARIESDSKEDDTQRQLFYLDQPDAICLMAVDDGHILFANQFAATTIADKMFFLLSVWKQLELDAQEDALVVLARKEQQPADLCKELTAYLAHVELMQPDDLFADVPLSREPQVPLPLMALLLNRF